MIASKGDLVVSYEEKTLIMWDMKTGTQKATFTADKVRNARVERTGLLVSSIRTGVTYWEISQPAQSLSGLREIRSPNISCV